MNGESPDIKQTMLQRLKGLFPELFAENQLDWEKLKAAFGEDINFANERYVLNWAGKADAFRVLQQPTTATLKPVPEESYPPHPLLPSPSGEGLEERWGGENLFIEGENLEVLKVLQKAYYGKVKVVCIDPPYNTGSDSFIYPDRFSEKKEDYLKRIGDKDEEGFLMKEGLFRKNSKDSGHFHSNWLSMMYPRLFLAKNLLRDDGVIFIHIDDNEVHNLRMVMNEIFGEENFVGTIIWRKKEGGGQTDDFFVTEHEYIIVYRKTDKFIWFDEEFDDDINNYKKEDEKGKFKTVRLAKWGSGARKEDRPTMHFPIISPDANEVLPIAPDGNDGRWRVGKKTMDKLINKNSIYWEKSQDRWIAYEKVYFNSEKSKKIKFRSILYNIASTGDGTNQLKELFGVKDVFQNPKPIEVISSFLKNNTEEEDVILDFFGGSGTTAHAVLELNKEDSGNRKFILVQLPEQCDEDSEAYKSGYKTIADIAKERIRRVIKNLTPHSPLLKERGRGERREGSYAENLFKGASPTLFENANKLRKNKTNAEESLWQAIRNKEIENCKFRRQHPIGQFIADFYCHEKKLVIEIDGGYHNETEQKTYDQARTQAINEFGVRVIRFTNEEILNSLPRVLKQISETLDSPSHLTSSPLSSRRGDGGEAYSINNNELIIALDTMNEKLVERIIAAKPQKVITLDSLFTGNDQLKTNTVLQMRDAGIDFKTI